DVELLILDEPTSGLDPLMEVVFRDCIREQHQRGRTVLLSSHILSKVEALCERVSIIRAGRTVETGTLAELRHLARTTVDATLERPVTAETFSALPGVVDVVVDGERVRCSVETGRLGMLLETLGGSGIRTLTSQPPSLEELFMDRYRTTLGPEPAV
ncbi:MAG: ABC transporter ATP-binding protein, partial [Actinomycetota bacterium]|nr:ABC transporter ATP-binding protein [Actinomycetota bacterium]